VVVGAAVVVVGGCVVVTGGRVVVVDRGGRVVVVDRGGRVVVVDRGGRVVVVLGALVVVGVVPVVGELPVVGGPTLVPEGELVVELPLAAVVGLAVPDFFVVCFEPEPALVDVVTPAVVPLDAATAGVTGAAEELVPGAWLEDVSPGWSDPEECGAVVLWAGSASEVVVVVALVATPAIEATTTVTTRTTPTTRAERRRVEAAPRRKAGRARSRSPAYRRLASANRRSAGSRVTRRLALRGWPTGANAPSMATVSLGSSWLGTRIRTGQPLTITSSAVAGRPSGVLPAPRTTARPPITGHDH